MRNVGVTLVLGAFALVVSTTASARVHVNVSINPFGFVQFAPPVIYQPEPYYAPPPVVYENRRSWDEDHDRERNRWHRRHHEHGR